MHGLRSMNYMLKPTGHATYQDILDAPEGVIAELINGELHTQPGASPRHQRISLILGGEIERHFRKLKSDIEGWHIIPDTNVHLSKTDICRPDIAGWKIRKMPQIPETAHISVIPDWVCEIISPSSERIDRHGKFAMYAKFGIKHYWIIDHKSQLIEAYELRADEWVAIGVASRDDIVSFAPFEDVSIDLSDLWDPSSAEA